MSNHERIITAIETALARGGGVIVVLNESQQLITESALSRMAARHPKPVDANRIAITVEPAAEYPHYRGSL